MKKITEKKPLDAATFDNSRLPLDNCEFWNQPDKTNFTGTLNAIQAGVYSFVRKCGGDFAHCAEVSARFPRDVPEGVTPLPEDKPFLAYVGTGGPALAKMVGGDRREPSLWALEDARVWRNYEGKGKRGEEEFVHYALDVSTAWAAENFPDIVEAMEYEPTMQRAAPEYGPEKRLVGHTLGDKTYDLGWNEICEAESFDSTEIVNEAKRLAKQRSIIEEEPLNWDSYCIRNQYYDPDGIGGILFEAGEARGKWEATRFKYGEAEMRDLLQTIFINSFPSNDNVEEILNLARQTREVG